MKLKGHKVNSPNIEIIPIPRDSGDLIFKAKAVLDFDDFLKLCPEPEPPKILRAGDSIPVSNIADPVYIAAKEKHSTARFNWLILKSLEATDGLEWETVDFTDPETWENYDKELQEAGLVEVERIRVINGVFSANGLDEDKIEQARKRFLALQKAQPESK